MDDASGRIRSDDFHQMKFIRLTDFFSTADARHEVLAIKKTIWPTTVGSNSDVGVSEPSGEGGTTCLLYSVKPSRKGGESHSFLLGKLSRSGRVNPCFLLSFTE